MGAKRRIREAEGDIPRRRAWGTEGAKRGEWGRRTEGVNIHIINLDYLGDRVATSPGALETAGRAFARSSQAIFTKNSLTSFTSCSGDKTLVRSFKSISPSWRKSAVKFTEHAQTEVTLVAKLNGPPWRAERSEYQRDIKINGFDLLMSGTQSYTSDRCPNLCRS